MDKSQSRSSSPIASIVKLLFSLAVIVVAILAILYRQQIIDTITVYRYEPAPAIASLVERSGMSDTGEFLFYASRPTLSDKDDFTSQCGGYNEETAILGCYSAMRIYLFDVDDERLDGVKEVTAAHEMLHAAYDRFSDSEKQQINLLLEEAYTEVADDRLESLLELYEESQPGQRSNELFSILGTEYANLPDELEQHYQRYFTDRMIVVDLASSYQSTFETLRNRQMDVVEAINQLVTTINQDSNQYNSRVATLSEDVARFNDRAASGDFATQAEFDTERNALLSRQAELQSVRTSIDEAFSQYEQLVAELDEINIVTIELNESLNPNLSEAPEL